MTTLLRLWRRHDGNIAVEVALVAPILLIMLAGIVDLGRAALGDARLKSAVRAGLEYAQVNPNNTAGIEAVVRAAANAPDLSVTTTLVCECPNGSAAECTATCSDGLTPGTYVVITAAESFAPLFPGVAAVVESPLQARGSIRAK